MKVWKYGDDINTDMLFPGKYTYTCGTLEEIKPHLLEDLDTDFATQVAENDIILAGTNFGCGSSREQPALGLRGVGIQAVIARSFARIFFRAAINQGLLLIECPEAVDNFQAGSTLSLNIDAGEIKIDDATYTFPTLPPAILAIRDAGGLMQFVRKKLKQKNV
ncbi:3-isopropylmalate dehydratase [bacterium]|nr:3-isopropylmalate dehydratase [bacterium]